MGGSKKNAKTKQVVVICLRARPEKGTCNPRPVGAGTSGAVGQHTPGNSEVSLLGFLCVTHHPARA